MKTAEQCALGIVNEIGIKALFEPSERDYGDAANYTLDNELALDIAQTRLQAFADIHTATLREELERVRSQQHIKRLQDELSACQRERDEARKQLLTNLGKAAEWDAVQELPLPNFVESELAPHGLPLYGRIKMLLDEKADAEQQRQALKEMLEWFPRADSIGQMEAIEKAKNAILEPRK